MATMTSETRRRAPRLLSLAIGLALAAGGAFAGGAPANTGDSQAASGTLTLRAVLALHSNLGPCPPDVTATDCAARTITGQAPGLGAVTSRYTFLIDVGPPACPMSYARAQGYPVRLVVAGKGAIDVTLAPGAECVEDEVRGGGRAQTQPFTITGGTGIYAGVSGSGVVERFLGAATDNGRYGTDTWVGSVVVPGLEFDTTRPTLSGAVNRTVRVKKGVKSARVVYRVAAHDDRDGSRPVQCDSPSGSRFPLGKTRVTCTAVDTSGNESTATFVITVRRR